MVDVKCSKLIGLFLILTIGLLACSQGKKPSELTPITVQLKWTHSAQFAGLYAADQNGYYADEGLVVTFLEGGQEVDLLSPVLDGTADVGVASGTDLITARAAGEPVRAVATIFRRSPFVYFAMAESGITRPEDFEGKIIQVPVRSRPIFYTIMARVGLAPSEYIESSLFGLEPLYHGEVDVAVGYVTSQVLAAREAGYDLNLIFPDDYGVHIYDDTLFATDAFIAAHPDLVLRFLRASLRGWTFAVENPDEAGTLVAHYNAGADQAYENAALAATLPFVNTGEDYIGWMTADIWRGMEQTFREYGLLTEPVDVSALYTTQFLEEIYPVQDETR